MAAVLLHVHQGPDKGGHSAPQAATFSAQQSPRNEVWRGLQVVLSWAGQGGGRIRRVVTRRLGATAVPASHLRDMDMRCAALLLAKGAVQDAVRAQGNAAGDLDLADLRASVGAARAPLHTPVLDHWFTAQPTCGVMG